MNARTFIGSIENTVSELGIKLDRRHRRALSALFLRIEDEAHNDEARYGYENIHYLRKNAAYNLIGVCPIG